MVAGNCAADVIDVRTGEQADVCPLNRPRPVSDVVGAKLDHFTAMNCAAVDQVTVQVHHDVLAPHQRAGTVNVARLYANIHLGHHHRLPATVCKLHSCIHQPDHVLRQQAHLFGGERHARDKLMLLSESNPRIHKCFELGFVIAVVAQIAPAGEGDDLLAH